MALSGRSLVGYDPTKPSVNPSKDPHCPLTVRDFLKDDTIWPAWSKHVIDREQVLDGIYLSNRTNKDLTFVGTPIAPDLQGMNRADPTNYEQQIKQHLQPCEWTFIPTPEKIEVAWSYIPSGRNSERIGRPGFTVTNPPNKNVKFIKRGDDIEVFVLEDSQVAPNAMELTNYVDGIVIYISIFKYVNGRHPTRSKQPVAQFALDTREKGEYVHLQNFHFWAFDSFEMASASGLSDSVTHSAIDTERGGGVGRHGTRRFRVGTSTWYDQIANINPGSYVVAVNNDHGKEPPIKLMAFDAFVERNLVPQDQFIERL